MWRRASNRENAVAGQITGGVSAVDLEPGTSPFQQFQKRKHAIHKRLKASFNYSLLSVYHCYYIFGSVIMGLSMGLNFSLGFFISWFQQVRAGASHPSEDGDALVTFFGVLLRSWLLLRAICELIRASVWLLSDAWRNPAAAFQLYRACITGGAFHLMKDGRSDVAVQLSRPGGWSYHYDSQWILDIVAQAVIIITFDIVPFAVGLHKYLFYEIMTEGGLTWLRWLDAVQHFQFCASSAAALHVFSLFIAWTLNDLAAKLYTLAIACSQLGSASQEEDASNDPEPMTEAATLEEVERGSTSGTAPELSEKKAVRVTDEVELQEASTFTSAYAGGTFASTRGSAVRAPAAATGAGPAADPPVAEASRRSLQPARPQSFASVSTTSSAEHERRGDHDSTGQELSSLMAMVIFVLEQKWCAWLRFLVYVVVVIRCFVINNLLEAVVISFLFAVFLHNNVGRLIDSLVGSEGGRASSRFQQQQQQLRELRWCQRFVPNFIRRPVPGARSLTSIRRWGEQQCGLFKETCAWQYKLLWVVLALEAALCLKLKWAKGFAVLLTLFVLTFTRWVTLRYFRPYGWLFLLVEGASYAIAVSLTPGSYRVSMLLTIWLIFARYEAFKYQAYKVSIFVMHAALVLIVAVTVSSAMSMLQPGSPRRLSQEHLKAALPPPLGLISSSVPSPMTEAVAAAATQKSSSSVGLPSEYAACAISFPLGREVPYTVYSKGQKCKNVDPVRADDCRQKCTEEPSCNFVTEQKEGESKLCFLSERCPNQEQDSRHPESVTYLKDVRSCEDTYHDEGQACQQPRTGRQRLDNWPCGESAETCASCCVQHASHFTFLSTAGYSERCLCWDTCDDLVKDMPYATSGRTCWKDFNQRLSIFDFGRMCQLTNYDSEEFRQKLPEHFQGWELVSFHEGTKMAGKRGGAQSPAEDSLKDWSTFFELSDPSNTTTIFAMRGTQEALDVMQDIDIWLSAALMQVAEWFGPELTQSLESVIYKFSSAPDQSGRALAPVLQERIKKRIKADPSRRFYFTGHSLGGGLASLMALEMGRVSVTFSAPGLGRTAGWMLSREARVERDQSLEGQAVHLLYNVIPTNDIVPQVDIQLGTQLRVQCSGNVYDCHQLGKTMDELKHGGCVGLASSK